MKTKYAVKVCCLSFFIFLSSCNKIVDTNYWKAEITENKANSLQDLFSQIGSEKLIDIVESKDIIKAESYNKMKANQIASYFLDKYNIDLRDKFIDNPEGIVILGMFYAQKEIVNSRLHMKSNSSLALSSSEENMNCFLTAIADVIGIAQAKSIWKSIVMGASEETVIAAVSLIGRRVAGILTVATMIYSTGGCLGWW